MFIDRLDKNIYYGTKITYSVGLASKSETNRMGHRSRAGTGWAKPHPDLLAFRALINSIRSPGISRAIYASPASFRLEASSERALPSAFVIYTALISRESH